LTSDKKDNMRREAAKGIRQIYKIILTTAALIMAGVMGGFIPYWLHGGYERYNQDIIQKIEKNEAGSSSSEPGDKASMEAGWIPEADALHERLLYDAEPLPEQSLPSGAQPSPGILPPQVQPSPKVLSPIDELILSLELPENSSITREWIREKLEKYGDSIAEEDKEDFVKIVGKLDTAYLTNIYEEGLDDEKYHELKDYLQKNLNSDEYERAKELFFLYNYVFIE
jgi:hypothetical protein